MWDVDLLHAHHFDVVGLWKTRGDDPEVKAAAAPTTAASSTALSTFLSGAPAYRDSLVASTGFTTRPGVRTILFPVIDNAHDRSPQSTMRSYMSREGGLLAHRLYHKNARQLIMMGSYKIDLDRIARHSDTLPALGLTREIS